MLESRRKDIEYAILLHRLQIMSTGFRGNPKIFEHLDLGNVHLEQEDKSPPLPSGFKISDGFHFDFIWNPESSYEVRYDMGKYSLYQGVKLLFDDLIFDERPRYYKERTSDGILMSEISRVLASGHICIQDSNQCVQKELGRPCFPCTTKGKRKSSLQGENKVTPKHIAETVMKACEEGYNKFILPSGFLSEKKEIEYYKEVSKKLKDVIKEQEIHLIIDISPFKNLDIIEQYKELGFKITMMNLTVDENILKNSIKSHKKTNKESNHGLKALYHAAKVFGKYQVQSYINCDFESKKSLFYGIEHCLNHGILVIPNQGGVYEGQQLMKSLTNLYEQLDIAKQTVECYKQYGISWEMLENTYSLNNQLVHAVYKIETGMDHN